MRKTHLPWPPYEKKLDSIHGRSSSRFRDQLWFQTKLMLFSQNQCINIMYPNENYPFSFTPHEKKLDSICVRSSSNFQNKLWFQTKLRLQMLFSQNQRINIVYPNENYPFVFGHHEKKLDSIHRRSLSCLKDKHILPNQRINIVYSNKNYPFFLVLHQK